MVSVYSMTDGVQRHSPSDFDCQHPREFLICSDAYQQLWDGYSESARSQEETVSDGQAGVYRTHIKDNKDSVEFGIPSGNRLLVIPRMKYSRYCIASALFDDLVLYFRNSPATESMVGIA